VYARDVFVPEFYRRPAEKFEWVRDERPEAFTVVAGYSATGVPLTALREGPLALFLSREWHDLIAGVATTGNMEGSLHRHPAGSPQGWPHNNLNPAWFGGGAPDRAKFGRRMRRWT
jgi:hypothetical protein